MDPSSAPPGLLNDMKSYVKQIVDTDPGCTKRAIKDKISTDLQINIRGREWRKWLDKVYNEVAGGAKKIRTQPDLKKRGVALAGMGPQRSRTARRANRRSARAQVASVQQVSEDDTDGTGTTSHDESRLEASDAGASTDSAAKSGSEENAEGSVGASESDTNAEDTAEDQTGNDTADNTSATENEHTESPEKESALSPEQQDTDTDPAEDSPEATQKFSQPRKPGAQRPKAARPQATQHTTKIAHPEITAPKMAAKIQLNRQETTQKKIPVASGHQRVNNRPRARHVATVTRNQPPLFHGDIHDAAHRMFQSFNRKNTSSSTRSVVKSILSQPSAPTMQTKTRHSGDASLGRVLDQLGAFHSEQSKASTTTTSSTTTTPSTITTKEGGEPSKQPSNYLREHRQRNLELNSRPNQLSRRLDKISNRSNRRTYVASPHKLRPTLADWQAPPSPAPVGSLQQSISQLKQRLDVMKATTLGGSNVTRGMRQPLFTTPAPSVQSLPPSPPPSPPPYISPPLQSRYTSADNATSDHVRRDMTFSGRDMMPESASRDTNEALQGEHLLRALQCLQDQLREAREETERVHSSYETRLRAEELRRTKLERKLQEAEERVSKTYGQLLEATQRPLTPTHQREMREELELLRKTTERQRGSLVNMASEMKQTNRTLDVTMNRLKEERVSGSELRVKEQELRRQLEHSERLVRERDARIRSLEQRVQAMRIQRQTELQAYSSRLQSKSTELSARQREVGALQSALEQERSGVSDSRGQFSFVNTHEVVDSYYR